MQVLRSYEELGRWSGSPVAMTVGFFDGLHLGHQKLLSELREEAARINGKSLAVTFSNSPRQYHDPGGDWKFLMTPEEKLYALSRSGVDAVLMLRYDESVCRQQAALWIRGLQHFAGISSAVFGYDTSIGNDLVSGREGLQQLCRELGIGCRIVDAFEAEGVRVKSSLLRDLVGSGKVRQAARLMGHPFFLLAKVVEGRGLGRDVLSIPTANQVLAPDKLAPLEGIYAGSAELGNRYLPAAICVMDLARARSSVVDRGGHAAYEGLASDAMIVESHVLGLEEKIYGQVFRLDFHSRIRDWEDFDSAAALQSRMEEDIEVTRSMTEASGNTWVMMQ